MSVTLERPDRFADEAELEAILREYLDSEIALAVAAGLPR